VIDLFVRNGSDEPVYAVRAVLLTPLNLVRGSLTGGEEAVGVRYEVIGPRHTEPFPVDLETNEIGPVEVTFTDSQGYRWTRHFTGRIVLQGGGWKLDRRRRRSVKDRLDAFAKGQVDDLDT
jgi:hypothetical protein